MSYWLLGIPLAFVMGFIFGLGVAKLSRAVTQTNLGSILAECTSAWYQSHYPAFRGAFLKITATLLGAAVCTVTAAGVAVLFRGSHYDDLIPVGFLVVLLICARYFGALGGIFGSFSAAAIFARLVYPPEGFAVSSPVAMTTLAFMIVAACVFSWFVAASRQTKHLHSSASAGSGRQ